MRISVISFTKNGAMLADKLAKGLSTIGHISTEYAMPRHTLAEQQPLNTTLSQWASEQFTTADAIIFVSACGIAVRAISPYITDKFTDPAVVVVDETAQFAVSLLSGHVGGANVLTQQVAGLCGAQAVVTTATDTNKVFAVDTWAKENNCVIADKTAAKKISAALLEGEQIGFTADFLWGKELPNGVVEAQEGALGFCVSLNETKKPFACTLRLIPRIITLGIGCRKGTSKAAIAKQVLAACEGLSISPQSIKQVCSINLKANEAGVLEYCNENNLPFVTYTAEELTAVCGEFTSSAFVKSTTGVDNVCERAAVLGSAECGGVLIATKNGENGVTTALACDDWRINFL